MATQRFKTAINNAKFPFLYSRAGHASLQPGFDAAPRTGAAFTGDYTSLDYNLVQMLYCENVLPTAEGVMSIGYSQDIDPYTTPVTNFDQFIILRDAQEKNTVFVPAAGQNYILDATSRTWTSYNSFTWAAGKSIVSRAYVNGRTFILYERDRLIEWNPSGPAFNTLTLTLPSGYAITDIRCCCGASNYLILCTNTEVLWCSLLNVLDFADTTVGKAGRQTPIDLKGQITAIVPISGGFIIYTNRNAVAAFFTNNADTPFTYREVQGSGGVSGYEQVTGDANQAEHYTYSSSGLQVLNLQNAQPIHPDCTDFLASRDYESWNTATRTIDQAVLTGPLEVKMQLLGNRYLVISYGKIAGQFTYALVYDLVLKRWGKLRINHVDVGLLPNDVLSGSGYRYFELTAANILYEQNYQDLVQNFGVITPIRAGFAFLQQDGTIQDLAGDAATSAQTGVLVIGHVQVTRARTVTFIQAQLEGLFLDPYPTVSLLGSAPTDGYNRLPGVVVTPFQTSPRMMNYKGRKVYENFDVAIEGKFSLTTAVVETMVHGSR